jgi:hypothetical protein
MAAATAAVTSIPGVVAPTSAARILLISVGEVVVEDPDKSVLTAETELIASTYFSRLGSLTVKQRRSLVAAPPPVSR